MKRTDEEWERFAIQLMHREHELVFGLLLAQAQERTYLPNMLRDRLLLRGTGGSEDGEPFQLW